MRKGIGAKAPGNFRQGGTLAGLGRLCPRSRPLVPCVSPPGARAAQDESSVASSSPCPTVRLRPVDSRPPAVTVQAQDRRPQARSRKVHPATPGPGPGVVPAVTSLCRDPLCRVARALVEPGLLEARPEGRRTRHPPRVPSSGPGQLPFPSPSSSSRRRLRAVRHSLAHFTRSPTPHRVRPVRGALFWAPRLQL